MVSELSYGSIRVMTCSHFLDSATLLEFQKIATEAAQVGGTILQHYVQAGFKIEHKDLVNLVTDADRKSEAAIVNVLRRAYPSHQILAE